MLLEKDQLREEILELKTQVGDLKLKISEIHKEKEQIMREMEKKMEKSGRMSETQLQIFRQTWTSLWERFDQTTMGAIKEQAQVDSETFINGRLLKSMEGIQVDENFLNLFKYQVQVLYTLFFHFKDLSAQVAQQTQLAQILEAKNV